jgi:hypothetical protein
LQVLGIFLAWANYCCIQAKRNSRQLSIDENLHSLFLKQIITSSFVLLQNIKGDLMKHPVSLLSCALLLCGFSSSPWAADVPQGTVLAQKQELVRHIKDEPASLDPAKAVGLPEIQVIRDLYEGLVNQNEKGDIIPGVATKWQTSDNRVWTFSLRNDANGPTARRSPHKILFIAGSAWSIRKQRHLLPGLRRLQESPTRRISLMARRRRINLA